MRSVKEEALLFKDLGMREDPMKNSAVLKRAKKVLRIERDERLVPGTRGICNRWPVPWVRDAP